MPTPVVPEPDPLDDVLAVHLPAWIQRMVHLRCGAGALGARLKRERGIVVFGVEPDEPAVSIAAHVLDGVSRDAADLTGQDLDCISASAGTPLPSLTQSIEPLLHRMSEHGMVLVTTGNPAYWRNATTETAKPTPQSVSDALAPLGLVPYLQWRIEDADAAGAPLTDGLLTIEGRAFEAPTDDARRELITRGFLLWYVRSDYNPIAHARAQLTRGKPSAAYELLLNVPDTFARAPEAKADLAAEKQLCLLVMDRREGDDGRLQRFAGAQHQFYLATSQVPGHALAFECQARFWRLIGDVNMAEKLERIVRQVHGDDSAQRPAEIPPPAPVEVEVLADVSHGIRRVLLLTCSLPDYGLDVIFDGLSTVLGDDNVVEFPWKPSLHGHTPNVLGHYPCTFDRPGRPRSENDLLAEAAAGKFDLILYGALDDGLDLEFLQRLADAAPHTPWVLLDQRDEPDDARPAFLQRLPRTPILAYFKRECLHCLDWDRRVVPLPFAYPDALVPREIDWNRPRSVFWAGHAVAGLRRAYLEHLAAHLGLVFPNRLPQPEYQKTLADSRIGLNFYGFGFDTVRYWELPAHGCMLVSDRLPIRIPHNFVDGVSAVFFDDLHDLESKLRHYLHHPSEATAIAQAGHAHMIKHHIASARARQLLHRSAELRQAPNAP